jgi:hypothetical protein
MEVTGDMHVSGCFIKSVDAMEVLGCYGKSVVANWNSLVDYFQFSTTLCLMPDI